MTSPNQPAAQADAGSTTHDGVNGRLIHLGPYSNWVDEAARQSRLRPAAPPGEQTRKGILELLGFTDDAGIPAAVRTERSWTRGGIAGQEVSWSVGFGPRTHAWILKPEGARVPLPAVVALHDHGGRKYYGKEKIADGPDDPPATVVENRNRGYGGRAFANDLAARGFVVLVHDVFTWGSRKIPLETIPKRLKMMNLDETSARLPETGPIWPRAAPLHRCWCNTTGMTNCSLWMVWRPLIV